MTSALVEARWKGWLSSMVNPAYLKRQGELHAILNINCVVEDGHLNASTEVESESTMDQTIHLNQNYRIPVRKQASNVEAYDLNNKQALKAFHDVKKGYIEVVFNRGTVLPPHQKFSWRMSHRVSGFEKKMVDDECHSHFSSHFSLNPLRSYKKVPIQNHRVHLRFIFKKRCEEDGKPLSTTLTQHNTLNIRASIVETPEGIECSFETFDLVRGEQVEFTFCRQERLASNEIAVKPPAIAAPSPRRLAKFLVFFYSPAQKAIEELVKFFLGKF